MTRDHRRLYIRALAVVRLHELRERLGNDAEQRELDSAVLEHAEKMLVNVARKLGLKRGITYDNLLEDARLILLETQRFDWINLVKSGSLT